MRENFEVTARVFGEEHPNTLSRGSDLATAYWRMRRLDDVEKAVIRKVLLLHEGNISKAARDADMDRKYLHKLLKKHQIDPSGV